MSEKVRLTPCYEFTCFDCGRNCLVRVPATDDIYSEEEIAEMYVELGVGADDGITIDLRPLSVTCEHCGISYEVEDESIEFDDRDTP